MKVDVSLRIVLEKPITGYAYGIQSGKGSDYETILTNTSIGEDLSFDFNIRASDNGGEPTFGGPIVQGPPAARFVYVDVGKLAGQKESCWERRMKIPLDGITWSMIRKLTAETILEARIAGTGKDGGPNCATIKGVSWKVTTR